MGSGSSIDYYASQAMGGLNSGYGISHHDPNQPPGSPQNNPNPNSVNGAPPPSTATLFRQQLLSAGHQLWRSGVLLLCLYLFECVISCKSNLDIHTLTLIAPQMLADMERLEQQNRALQAEVSQLRGVLSQNDLFPTLDQLRRENEQLKRQLQQNFAQQQQRPYSPNNGSPRHNNQPPPQLGNVNGNQQNQQYNNMNNNNNGHQQQPPVVPHHQQQQQPQQQNQNRPNRIGRQQNVDNNAITPKRKPNVGAPFSVRLSVVCSVMYCAAMFLAISLCFTTVSRPPPIAKAIPV